MRRRRLLRPTSPPTPASSLSISPLQTPSLTACSSRHFSRAWFAKGPEQLIRFQVSIMRPGTFLASRPHDSLMGCQLRMKFRLAAGQENDFQATLLPFEKLGTRHLALLVTRAVAVLHFDRAASAHLKAITVIGVRCQLVGSKTGAWVVDFQQINGS